METFSNRNKHEWEFIFGCEEELFAYIFACFQQFNLLSSVWIKCCFLLSLGCRMFLNILHFSRPESGAKSCKRRSTTWNAVRFYWNHPITITNDTFTRKRLFPRKNILWLGWVVWDSKGCSHVIDGEKTRLSLILWRHFEAKKGELASWYGFFFSGRSRILFNIVCTQERWETFIRWEDGRWKRWNFY